MGDSLRLKHWYFCVNDAGFQEAFPLIRVAVRSAQQNTDLSPICIYNGHDAERAARLTGLGVELLHHECHLADVLKQGYGPLYDKFSGHWLRVDIPLLEQREAVVLYTDIDVMFRSHPVVPKLPRYLAAAPERYKWRWPAFNSGVMVLNIDGMRKTLPLFEKSIQKRMEIGWKPPGHDQISYNQAYRFRRARLDLALNWKPYWGPNDKAQIVHFHGPKPVHIRAFKAGHFEGILPIYRKVWEQGKTAYDVFCAEFETYSSDP